jgi:hypothetical protein
MSTNNSYCPQISTSQMHQLIEQGSVAQIVTLQAGDSTVVAETMPAAIQHVIAQHTTLLQEPEGMPPVRAFDH